MDNKAEYDKDVKKLIKDVEAVFDDPKMMVEERHNRIEELTSNFRNKWSKTPPVTNLVMEVWCSYFNEKGSKRKQHWKERFILGDHRKELDRLTKIGEKSDDGRAWMVVGQDDDLWWNDDMVFLLDRFCANDLEPNETDGSVMDWPKGLEEFCDKILTREYEKVGETLTYEHKGLKIKVTADCSDVSKGELKFL